jgi:SAM-dependent methyltransferase
MFLVPNLGSSVFMKPIKEALEVLNNRIVHLIQDALGEATVSNSSLDNIVTGNAYQSILLGRNVTKGFRERDASLFAGIPLTGKRFVDLGCNLGEKTRLALLSGAAYAEGIEFEEYFVRIGGLINFSNRVENIVLRQGDVTKPGCITEKFDVGACFSAFVYVEKNLEEIVASIRQLFILETHALDADWYGAYVKRVERLMPSWVLLGFTDHGAGHEKTSRCLLAFSRDKELVTLTAINRCEALPITHADVCALDLDGTRRAKSLWGNTNEWKTFFTELRSKLMQVANPSPTTVVGIVRPELARLEALCDTYTQEGSEFGTHRYWLYFLQGLCHFVDTGGLAASNPYLICLRQMSAGGSYDPGMTYELADEARAVQRIAPRLTRFLQVLRDRAIHRPLLVYNPLSLRLLEARGYEPSEQVVRDEHIALTDGRQYRIQFIDGNHRLAALWLSGAKACPILPVWTNVFGLDRARYSVFRNAAHQDENIGRVLAETVYEFSVTPSSGEDSVVMSSEAVA